MDQLHKELTEAATTARRLARRNYILAYFVSGVIVVSSITAGLLVGISGIPTWCVGALASLPAAMVATSTVFRFEQKSAWFWKKTKRLDTLLRGLKYEGADPVAISQAFSKIEEEMEQEWISFGTLGKGGT